jgi:hypothetical protein
VARADGVGVTREDAIAALELAALCMKQEREPCEFVDKWVKGVLITEEMAGVIYHLMSIAIEKVH